MAWQDETKILIQDLLSNMIDPCTSGGSIRKIEMALKNNLELGIQTIDKIQEHQTQIEELQAGDVSIPIKIWEGVWNSETLTPNSDIGHILNTGNLADYNVLIFVVKTDDSSDSSVHSMPQEMYNVFNSNLNNISLNVRDRYIKFHFTDSETLNFDLNYHIDLVQIWGIK